MISSFNSSTQTLTTNESLLFNSNRILTGCTITHAEGTSSFVLHKPGYYYVSFNGSGCTADTAGNITVTLFSNGTEVSGANATDYSTATDTFRNLSFSTIVKVLPSCCYVDNTTTLTFQNTGIGAIFDDVNVNITKLC